MPPGMRRMLIDCLSFWNWQAPRALNNSEYSPIVITWRGREYLLSARSYDGTNSE